MYIFLICMFCFHLTTWHVVSVLNATVIVLLFCSYINSVLLYWLSLSLFTGRKRKWWNGWPSWQVLLGMTRKRWGPWKEEKYVSLLTSVYIHSMCHMFTCTCACRYTSYVANLSWFRWNGIFYEFLKLWGGSIVRMCALYSEFHPLVGMLGLCYCKIKVY